MREDRRGRPPGTKGLPLVPGFGDRLRDLREAREVSLEKVARAVGVTRQAVHQWEHNRVSISAPALRRLALYFNVSADYFLGITSDSRVGVEVES